MVGQSQIEHPTAQAIRKSILNDCLDTEDVGVFLSGGIDSNAILAAYLANGVRPMVFSFCLDGRPSTDFRTAQITCKRENLVFIPVFLPTVLDVVLRDVETLIGAYGARGKAEIEAFWGCWYAIRKAHENGVKIIATGLGAGALFGDGRDPAIRGHGPDGNDPTWMDELRQEKFAKPNYAQAVLWQKVCKELGIENIRPFHNPRLQDIMKGHSWVSCNGVREKQPLHDAFPETAKWKVKKHTNLQLGDSGISALFAQLVNHPVNTKGYKSVVGIYNEIIRGQA
jgi:asparagine synthetase B (glutamine-hydrolysing)